MGDSAAEPPGRRTPTIGGKLIPDPPNIRTARSSSHDASSSVVSGVSEARSRSKARSANCTAWRVSAISCSSLIARSSLSIFPLIGRNSTVGSSVFRCSSVSATKQMTLESDFHPLLTFDDGNRRLHQLLGDLADIELQPRALFFELGRVPAVGDHQLQPRLDQQIAAVPGEAGEVLDVGLTRDEKASASAAWRMGCRRSRRWA